MGCLNGFGDQGLPGPTVGVGAVLDPSDQQQWQNGPSSFQLIVTTPAFAGSTVVGARNCGGVADHPRIRGKHLQPAAHIPAARTRLRSRPKPTNQTSRLACSIEDHHPAEVLPGVHVVEALRDFVEAVGGGHQGI